ncbi:MAG: hypothetical protein AVDCRST_MAG69-1957, partial [uncultured Solirubrobacteraceae bacterium]
RGRARAARPQRARRRGAHEHPGARLGALPVRTGGRPDAAVGGPGPRAARPRGGGRGGDRLHRGRTAGSRAGVATGPPRDILAHRLAGSGHRDGRRLAPRARARRRHRRRAGPLGHVPERLRRRHGWATGPPPRRRRRGDRRAGVGRLGPRAGRVGGGRLPAAGPGRRAAGPAQRGAGGGACDGDPDRRVLGRPRPGIASVDGDRSL